MPDSLLDTPLYSADTLGCPLPDEPSGVSVSLPLWEHVVGYEEGDEAVISRFRSGYPRFCCPPAITELAGGAEQELGGRCLVFPAVVHAERGSAFVLAREPEAKLAVLPWRGFGVLQVAEASYKVARLFWRYCGEIISTRQAQAVLSGKGSAVSPEAGHAAAEVIRERIASSYGVVADAVFLFPSGMAAIYAVQRMLMSCFPGRKTAQLEFPYVDALKVQEECGQGVHFFPVMDEAAYHRLGQLLEKELLAGAYTEVPSNPLLRCVDLQRVLEMRRRLQPGLPLILDDTVGTSVQLDAMRAADVVTTSLTKSFSGAGNVLAGSVALNPQSEHYARFRAFLVEHAGHVLWAEDAVVLEQNSRDYTERMQVVSKNSLALYAFLKSHPAVERVWHAHQEGGAGYQFLQREEGAYGCLLSFALKEAAATARVYDALRCCKGPSLGTNFTLVCPYTLLAHYHELDWAASCGVPAHLLRVSVGLEPAEEIIRRFSEALERV
jgi:cystathionine gamma-synthase